MTTSGKTRKTTVPDGFFTATVILPDTLYIARHRGSGENRRLVWQADIDLRSLFGHSAVATYFGTYGVKQGIGDAGAFPVSASDTEVAAGCQARLDSLMDGLIPGATGRGGGSKVSALFHEVQAILNTNGIPKRIAATVADAATLSAVCSEYKIRGKTFKPQTIIDLAAKNVTGRAL